ncbi:response regulator [Salipaludibacillus agaradhaerens]|uniref:Response regulator n=1 Tax=Salipaludibacillus agaradhaerens TaxID=76935 RepID=A0A9Q4B645_SALAG|nr:response regulator [Salipaludibacillus agaradhaerens]MCR6098667.1 response regulator [Salipaludibacillus agaradhaerens]MCR6115674.1 response regulator [Salipaludibacillus agaradhaerens]
MKKYQQMMYDRIKKTVGNWRNKGNVHEYEVYHLLHSIKGTAGTIGMDKLSEEAEALLDYTDVESEKLWGKTEWLPFVERIESAFEPSLFQDKTDEIKQTINFETPVSQPDVPFILIVDDDVEFVTHTKTFVEREGFQVVIALTGEKGLELFYQVKPSLIILDQALPDIDGIELLKQIFVKAQKDVVPIVMVGTSDCEENRIKAYEMGATDFIAKPLNMNVLIPFLHNRIRHRKHMLKQIGEDELTGAYNRKYLERELSSQLVMLKKDDRMAALSFIIVDIDHFKSVNDRFGHPKGDEVLKEFVHTFMKIKAPMDTISRYGGEEFAIVMPDTSKTEAFERIKAWRESFSNVTFNAGDNTFNVMFSAGIKEVTVNDDHLNRIIEQADKALYHAKETGRNKTQFYEEALEYTGLKDFVTIIIVDDDEVVRQMMTHHFNKRGEVAGRPVKVRTFPDGVAFLEGSWYQTDQQFMILLDGRMPKMDGIEVLQKLRETYGNKNIVISMLTARKGEVEVARALNLGADDYMVKPFNANEVAARIDRLLERMFN